MEPAPQPLTPGICYAIELIHCINSRFASDDTIPFRERVAIDRVLRSIIENLEKEIKRNATNSRN